MLKSCREQAYFLFGDFAVKFDWLSRPNGFEFEKFQEDWTEFVACGYVLLVLTTFNMAAKFWFSMRNNLLAIWKGLTVSSDIENKFEI